MPLMINIISFGQKKRIVSEYNTNCNCEDANEIIGKKLCHLKAIAFPVQAHNNRLPKAESQYIIRYHIRSRGQSCHHWFCGLTFHLCCLPHFGYIEFDEYWSHFELNPGLQIRTFKSTVGSRNMKIYLLASSIDFQIHCINS